MHHTSSTHRTTRLLASDLTKLAPEKRAFIDALCKAAPEVVIAAGDVRALADLLRQDDPAGLDAAAMGLRRFAAGRRQYVDAVRAAITQS